MMGMRISKIGLKLAITMLGGGLFCILQAVVMTPGAAALDNPHVSSNVVSCDNCHANPAALDFNNQGDQTIGVCGQCHNPSLIAEPVKVHVSPKYGGTQIQCTECHNPHAQNQVRKYTTDATRYFQTGTLSTALNAVTNTQLILSAPLPALPLAGTTAPSSWVDMVIIPDKRYVAYMYRIAGYNSGTNTITIATGKNGSETINTAMIKPGASYAIIYGKLIKEYVRNKPVKFFRPEGTNSFADGDVTIDGVCQVCHTLTVSFTNTGVLENGSHPTGQAGKQCTGCHNHNAANGGFQPECNTCHGSPPDSNATLIFKNKSGSPVTSDSPTIPFNNGGSHTKHTTSNLSCWNCHNGGMVSGAQAGDDKINIGFTLNSTNLGGNYDGKNGRAVYDYLATPPTTVSRTNTYQCSNLYCHSTGQSTSNPNDATPTYAAPSWTNAASGACGTCHKVTEASGLTSGSHAAHLGTAGVNGCGDCHTGAANDASSYASTNHVNRLIDVADSYTAGGTPGNGYGTCSTASCHTNVQADGGGAGTTIATPTWGTSVACGECHKGRKTDATTMDTGRHTKHLSYAQIDCVNCHSSAGDGTALHFNNNIDVIFNAFSGSGGAYSQAPNPPGNGYGTCSALYCHSQGQSTTSPYGGGPNTVPGWATASLDCKGCHNYTAASLSPMASGSHTAHVNDGTIMANKSCDACHVETTSNGTSITNTSLHVNGAKNVGIAGTYDSDTIPSNNFAANACNNVYCHSDGKTTPTYKSVTWGTTITGCTACHDNANATTTLSGAHKAHTFGATATVGRDLGCEQCHADTVSNSTTISTPANHVDTVKTIKVQIDNTACNNIKCHSDGNFDGTVTYNNPVWTATLGCTSCHGDGATKAYPSYADGNSGTGASNSHNKHVGSSGIKCEECHQTTSIDGTAINGTTPANHVNQTVDMAFKQGGSYNTPGNEQCSSTYCHGGTSPTWGGASIACNGCHDATNTTPGNLSTRHDKHYASGTAPTDRTATNAHTASAYVFGCGNCHPNGTTHSTGPVSGVQAAEIGGTKQTGANYTPAVTNLVDGRGYKYTNYGTCSTVCHTKDGVTLGSGIVAAPSWNGSNSLGCGYCHSKPADAARTWSAPHDKHLVTYSANTNITCNACHSGTASDNSTIGPTGRNQHPNANRDLAMNAFAGGAGVVIAGAQGAQTCANTYCHSEGTSFTGPTHSAINWSGNTTCTSCHTGGTTTGPTYANGNPKANSHAKHTATYTCEKCHNDTTTTGNTITGYANHPNKAYNIQQSGGTVTFTPTIGNPTTPTSCNTISCHGGNNATWGGAALKCGDCHLTATAQADVDNYNFTDGTAAKISLDEWRYSGHGKTSGNYDPPVTGNPAANLQGAAGTGDECLYCHDGVTFNHADAGNPFRLRNFSDATFGKNGNCLKCHATTGGTGVDPDGAGTTYANKTATKKVDKYHYGSQHSASLNGGQFCWDCHDPHGDRTATGGPILMVHLNPYAVSDSVTGAPTTIAGTNVLFTNNATPSDYGKTGAPYNGVCNVCHTYKLADPNKMVHYTATSSDSHNSGTLCTQCHKHSADTVYNGDAFKGGGCNGCHDYDTRVGFNWGDGFTGQAVEGFGAHKKHIDHIKARFAPLTLDPNLDQFGTGAAAQVCGTCHTNTAANHTTGGGTRLINFGDGTYKEGGSTGFSFLFGASNPVYNGLSGTPSSVNPKSCSNVSCHFQATPVWNTY